MNKLLCSLLSFSSALFPAMGETPASPAPTTAKVTFSSPKLSTPLTEKQQQQAGLLLCRVHDRASADAAAVQFSQLLSSVEGEISHWSQFGNTRFWEEVLPTIAAADYFGSESLKALFTPLTTPDADAQKAATPYIRFMQEFAETCAAITAALENVKDAASAEKACAAVQAFTAQLPEWEQRALSMPRPVGDVPLLLATQMQRTQVQLSSILRAWAELQLRSSDAYGKPAILTQALPELAATLRKGTGLKVPRPDKLSELYRSCETFLPRIHVVMDTLAAVTDRESADTAASTLKNCLNQTPHSIDRWMEAFYPASKSLLRQMSTLYRELSQKEPPFYGSEKLEKVFSSK